MGPETEVMRQRAAPRRKRGRVWRAAGWGVLVGLAVGLAVDAKAVLAGRNLHEVIPGRIYRSAQLSPADLAAVVRAHGIRTVVNLRGCAAPWPWYLDEARATAELDINQEDICLSPYRLPPVQELRRLVDVLDRTEYPILLHCRRGADRTGLASAVALLLTNEASFAQGRWQLGLRFGHVPLGPTAALDGFLDGYRAWLGGRGLRHSSQHFRCWAREEYSPGGCWAHLERIPPTLTFPSQGGGNQGDRSREEGGGLAAPTVVKVGRPFAVHMRCRNDSMEAWHLCEDANAGIHAGFNLYDAEDRQLASGRSGLFAADVPPGGSIDLTVPVPALGAAGKYRLLVDLVDERRGWFFEFGSEPLEWEFVARE